MCESGHKNMWGCFMCRDCGLLALRLTTGLIFAYQGYGKLFIATAMTVGFFGKLGFAPATFWVYLVGITEFVGGILLILGVYTRYTAMPLAVVMLVAMFTAHRGGPVMGYFLPLSLLGGLIGLISNGGGKFSLLRCGCGKSCSSDKMMDKKDDACCGTGGCCDKEDKKM